MSSLKEDIAQESKEFVNDFLGCLFSPFCILMMLGILGLILWIIIASVFNLSYEPGKASEVDYREQEIASSAKNIAWDYLKEQEPTAKITSISSSPLNSSVTVVQGKLKKKNAFGQWAHHSFRITVTDGLVTGCETKFLGFK